MQTKCVSNKDNAKSNDSDHIFVIRENTRIDVLTFKHGIQHLLLGPYNLFSNNDHGLT